MKQIQRRRIVRTKIGLQDSCEQLRVRDVCARTSRQFCVEQETRAPLHRAARAGKASQRRATEQRSVRGNLRVPCAKVGWPGLTSVSKSATAHAKTRAGNFVHHFTTHHRVVHTRDVSRQFTRQLHFRAERIQIGRRRFVLDPIVKKIRRRRDSLFEILAGLISAPTNPDLRRRASPPREPPDHFAASFERTLGRFLPGGIGIETENHFAEQSASGYAPDFR